MKRSAVLGASRHGKPVAEGATSLMAFALDCLLVVGSSK